MVINNSISNVNTKSVLQITIGILQESYLVTRVIIKEVLLLLQNLSQYGTKVPSPNSFQH